MYFFLCSIKQENKYLSAFLKIGSAMLACMFVFMVIVGYMVQSKIESMKFKLLSWLNPITWSKFIWKTV
jgi:hypothetical protein